MPNLNDFHSYNHNRNTPPPNGGCLQTLFLLAIGFALAFYLIGSIICDLT